MRRASDPLDFTPMEMAILKGALYDASHKAEAKVEEVKKRWIADPDRWAGLLEMEMRHVDEINNLSGRLTTYWMFGGQE